MLSGISDHEDHCKEIVPLMKETMEAILSMQDRLEIEDMFDDVKKEIDLAKHVLQDIKVTVTKTIINLLKFKTLINLNQRSKPKNKEPSNKK